MQHVQMLALVLVDALHLDVEQRTGIDHDAGALADVARQPFLVGTLDAAPLLLEGAVPDPGLEGLEPREIRHPALAHRLIEQLRERRVAEHHEAARRHPIGDVAEALRPELRKVPQHRLLQQPRMQRRHPVHRVTADGGEVRHAYTLLATLVDERHAREAPLVAGIALAHFREKAAIDFVDDLERPRQQLTKQRQAPGLEGFRKQRVVGVGQGAARQLPGLLPR